MYSLYTLTYVWLNHKIPLNSFNAREITMFSPHFLGLRSYATMSNHSWQILGVGPTDCG